MILIFVIFNFLDNTDALSLMLQLGRERWLKSNWCPKQAHYCCCSQVTDNHTNTNTPTQTHKHKHTDIIRQRHADTDKHGQIGNKLCHRGKAEVLLETKFHNNNSAAVESPCSVPCFLHFWPILHSHRERDIVDHFHQHSRGFVVGGVSVRLSSSRTRVWLRSSTTVAAAALPPPADFPHPTSQVLAP